MDTHAILKRPLEKQHFGEEAENRVFKSIGKIVEEQSGQLFGRSYMSQMHS